MEPRIKFIPLLPCFCNEDKELEMKAMVMDLIFLRTYEQDVRAHGARIIDESQKIQFFNTWEPILGAEKANAVFEVLQKHLKYALDIANITDSSQLSALVIAIHARILAFNRGVNYLAYTVYAQFNPSVTFKLEHCQNIVINLFIFTKLGSEELMKKFLSIMEPRMKWLRYLVKNVMKDLLEIPTIVGLFLKPNLLEEQFGSAALWSLANNGHLDLFHARVIYEIEKRISRVKDLGLLLLDMNSGAIETGNVYGGYRFYNSIAYNDAINFWTDTSFQINEKLEQTSPSDSDQRRYDVMSILRETIIHRAERDGVNRRDIVEIFEIVKPDHLTIYLNVTTLVTNVDLWNSI